MKLIECPRDAMQGLEEFIPTAEKAAYINSLLKVGFDTLDFGSFVSPKSIPQMKDTAKVVELLDLSQSNTHLLAIVANARGAEEANNFEEIAYLGYPFSISETFQQRNTNASIDESLIRVEEIQDLCVANGKTMVVYISMAFGNPYGDVWSPEIAGQWCEKLHRDLGIEIIALADTIGVSNPGSISSMFKELIPAFPEVEFGAHLHTKPEAWQEKMAAAYLAGCRRFDGAIGGLGGCPMADDKLVGNMPTELMLGYIKDQKVDLGLDEKLLQEAVILCNQIMG